MIKREKYAKISVLLLIAISIFMVINGNRGKKVVNKNELTLEERQFAIYKDDGLGNYTISNDTSFPTKGYLLSMERTKCFDSNNTGISNNILSQGSDGKITLQATQASYCDLYFTKDDEVPVVTTFSITGTKESNTTLTNGYTHKTNVTYNIEWTANDVVSYCISTSQSSCNGSWIEVTGTSVSSTTPALDGTEGTKKMYAFIKDKANNISSSKEATITLDLNNPTVTSVTYKSKDTSSITVTVEGSDTPTGSGVVTKQCKATTQSTWYDQDENGNCKVEDLLEGKEYTIEGRVIDASGRVSTNSVNTTQSTNAAYKCSAGETLVQDSQKGSSSGGYICTASASSKGWYDSSFYYTCGATPGTRYDNKFSAIRACKNDVKVSCEPIDKMYYVYHNGTLLCAGDSKGDLNLNCSLKGFHPECGEETVDSERRSVCYLKNSSSGVYVRVYSWPGLGTECGGMCNERSWMSLTQSDGRGGYKCGTTNEVFETWNFCSANCYSYDNVSSWTSYSNYRCKGDLGWSVYSGSDSTLRCYRAATKG